MKLHIVKSALLAWFCFFSSSMYSDIHTGWLSSHVRPSGGLKADAISEESYLKLHAWRGEQIYFQALIVSDTDVLDARLKLSELKSEENIINPKVINYGFIQSVLTDKLGSTWPACNIKGDVEERASTFVMDRLSWDTNQNLESAIVYPVWIAITIPEETPAGEYNATFYVESEQGKSKPISFAISVSNRTLIRSAKTDFHLDLWQNPYSVARYFEVPLWSDAHFDAMRPVMERLANAGQKVITTTLIHRPWNGQTYDPFESMISITRQKNNTWHFDYTAFDKWVEFMMEVGVKKQINCFSVAPWNETVRFMDEATSGWQELKGGFQNQDYAMFWRTYLADFAAHLKAKGWFQITTIAMDERPLQMMKQVIDLIREVDPDFKIALAGDYHTEIEADIYDYCIPFYGNFPMSELQKRHREGKVTTYYTCCTEELPNTFTFSVPAEATWLGWYAAASNLNGYLRWAYNSWNGNPLQDSRYSKFAAGDCFLVYPESYSSIRMEKLVEGIQDYRKIQILKEEFAKDSVKLKSLDNIVAPFRNRENIHSQGAIQMVSKAKKALSELVE